ncbi:hypothetical protein C9J21_22535, partial [Photobacterium phosphoreum]|uniref:hypothetical protein n=1 Tax=Photobacterium phosphoreum TaxID=659 RepID=UPI000D4485E0
MISLSSIKGGASGASNYYLKEEKEANLSEVQFTLAPKGTQAADYYLANLPSKENTQWFGQLAKLEGIENKPMTAEKLNH